MGFWNPFSNKEEREEAVTCKDNGDTYFHGGNYPEAISYYRRAIQLNPKYGDAHYALGFVYFRLKKYEESEIELKKAVSCNPGERRYHYYLGRLYLETEAFEEALRSFKTAAKLDPGDHESLYYTAVAYKNLKRFDWAATYLKRALEIVPGNSDYKMALDELPEPQPEPEPETNPELNPEPQPLVEEALPPMEIDEPDALEIQRESSWECILEGDAAYDKEDFSRALDCYRDAVVKDPTAALAYCCQAKVYARTGDINRARLHADMAYRIDSRDTDLLIEIASVYLMMHDFWKALELLKEAQAIDTDSAAVLNAIGAVYINMLDYKEAAKYFRKALGQEPGNEVIIQNLEEAERMIR